MNLWQILIQTLRARVLPIFTRLRLFLTPSYLLARITETIRIFFQKILDVRPRDKDDYYPFGRYLVSKRLCFAIVIIIGVLSCLYIYIARNTLFPGSGDEGIKTYDYNSLFLKFAKGKVRIRGKSGYLAYEGEVSDGSCNGQGTLMNPQGIVVYQGNFFHSMYENEGTQYYQSGHLWYKGDFHENLHSGVGSLYRENGTLEYEGEFELDMKEGNGVLYDLAHNRIYGGRFSRDEILYSDLIGKSSSEVAEAYTGARSMYQSSDERVRFLNDIGAMTVEYLDENSIDEEASVETVYVLKKDFRSGSAWCDSIHSLPDALGAPVYVGVSNITLPEALAINYLNERDGMTLDGPVDMSLDNVFTEYTEVKDYDRSYQVYLHTYHKDGLIYSFVSDRGADEFKFYFIIAEDLGDIQR